MTFVIVVDPVAAACVVVAAVRVTARVRATIAAVVTGAAGDHDGRGADAVKIHRLLRRLAVSTVSRLVILLLRSLLAPIIMDLVLFSAGGVPVPLLCGETAFWT